MLEFSCPHCDQHITAESSDAGAVTQCPSCGGEIVVPAATSEVVVEMVATETSAESPSAPDAPSEPAIDPEPTPGAEAEGSFADRMKEGAKEGWGGIKRHSKQVAL